MRNHGDTDQHRRESDYGRVLKRRVVSNEFPGSALTPSASRRCSISIRCVKCCTKFVDHVVRHRGYFAQRTSIDDGFGCGFEDFQAVKGI